MSAPTRRRRGLVLLTLALACGALAASEVGDRVSEVEGRIGVPVPVVVAARDIEPGAELSRADLRLSHVPQRFAPPDAPTRKRCCCAVRARARSARWHGIARGCVLPSARKPAIAAWLIFRPDTHPAEPAEGLAHS